MNVTTPNARFARRKHRAMTGLVGLALALSACSGAPATEAEPVPEPRRAAAARPPRPAPPRAQEPANVVAALALPEFATINRLLRDSGEGASLSRMAQATLLAPRDTAFAQMDEAQRRALAAASGPAAAIAMRRLSFDRTWRADELKSAIRAARTMPFVLSNRAGENVTIALDGPLLRVTLADGSTATMGDTHIQTRNGATYVLDHWVGPLPGVAAAAGAAPATGLAGNMGRQ